MVRSAAQNDMNSAQHDTPPQSSSSPWAHASTIANPWPGETETGERSPAATNSDNVATFLAIRFGSFITSSDAEVICHLRTTGCHNKTSRCRQNGFRLLLQEECVRLSQCQLGVVRLKSDPSVPIQNEELRNIPRLDVQPQLSALIHVDGLRPLGCPSMEGGTGSEPLAMTTVRIPSISRVSLSCRTSSTLLSAGPQKQGQYETSVISSSIRSRRGRRLPSGPLSGVSIPILRDTARRSMRERYSASACPVRARH